MNRILILLILLHCFSGSKVKANNNFKTSADEKFMKKLNKYAKKNKCMIVKSPEYAPYIVRDLEGSVENNFNSALFFCQRGDRLGVLVYISDKMRDKVPISKCPRFIPNIIRNETMGLAYRNGKVYTSLGMDSTYYFCKKGEWYSGMAH